MKDYQKIQYIAVCSPKEKGCWWTCNGGWADTESEARSIANRHSGIKDLGGKIERFDTRIVDIEDNCTCH